MECCEKGHEAGWSVGYEVKTVYLEESTLCLIGGDQGVGSNRE